MLKQTQGLQEVPVEKPPYDKIELFHRRNRRITRGLILAIIVAAAAIAWTMRDALRAKPAHGAEPVTITVNVTDMDDIRRFLAFAGMLYIGPEASSCGASDLIPLGMFHDRLERGPDRLICYKKVTMATLQEAVQACAGWDLEFVTWVPPMLTCRGLDRGDKT